MRFFRFKSPGWLSAAVLAVFLASAPTPAHAIGLGDVFNAINSLISATGGWFQQLFNWMEKDITAQLQGMNVLSRQMRDVANFTAAENRRIAMGALVGQASLNYQPPTEYACAVVTDGQSEAGRVVGETMAVNSVARLMGLIFNDPEAGTTIPQRTLQKLYCKLGVTGPDNPSCTTAFHPKVRGAHTSFDTAIAEKWCIPFDTTELMNDITQAIQNPDGYAAKDTTREAFVAILYLRRMLGSHCSQPHGQQLQTVQGIASADQLINVLAARMAQTPAITEILRYHLCFSQTMLPNCTTQDNGMRNYLKESYGGDSSDREPWMPPGNYCLSRWQTDLAKNERDRRGLSRPPDGSNAERHTWMAAIRSEIKAREDAHSAVKARASAAAKSIVVPDLNNVCPGGARPMER